MTSEADKARAKEMLDKTSRLGMIVESAAESAKDLKRFIKALRDEGCAWDDIGRVLDLPGYAVRVIAGEIRSKRTLPEYQRAARK